MVWKIPVATVVFIAFCGGVMAAGLANKPVAPPVCVPGNPVKTDVPAGTVQADLSKVQAVVVNQDKSITLVVYAGIMEGFDGEYAFGAVAVDSKGAIADVKPDPHAGCVTMVTIDGGKATIKCHKDTCATNCGMFSVEEGGTTSFVCQCNLPPTPR